ncbi:uncharacterized protein PGTG_20583 [Puccinia graminis f. sp. tritici CRL 75-36-700-3]|uniref:DUF7918 domain-containing protein n=1 Tax=Puccinia graminis f. sp. tritici (strain CRL 75-36-700-3 / race SCCL) TaxID=418459 RepID=H6QNZ9_PUCGT|nr:uncharacterized protein PGTG_20583 [Puccinia graminis f. sp. tritici CRL 75-36-700-3]EHS62458.1 hypothetical protein PGTG_20583 [Puccinia graminis f. sp. tritici CRL 75-36-700-3]
MPINAATGASCTINLLPPPPTTTSSSSSNDQIPEKIPCEEYKHETTTNPTTGAIQETVTIESQQACPFEIFIDIKPTAYSTLTANSSSKSAKLKPQDYVIHTILDGISAGYCKRPKSNSDGSVRLSKTYSRDQSSFRSYQFAPITLVDPDDYDPRNQIQGSARDPTETICEDEKVIKSLGTIQVDIIRADLVHRRRKPAQNRAAPVPSTNQMLFSERSKKARLLNTAGLSNYSPSNLPPAPMEWHIKKQDPQPFLQFIFKYKPRVILEDEGTIARDPSHAPHINQDIEDDDHDDEQESDRKPFLKRLKSEATTDNNNDDENQDRQTKKPKIIDLTGSDDSD